MIRANRLNRFVTLATLPLMAIVIVYASRAVQTTNLKADPPREGMLVVANLRAESLSLVDMANGTTSTLALPGPPHEMVAAAGRLYITLGHANLLVEADPYAPGILRTLTLDGEPHGLAIEGDRLYVTLDRANELVTIDRTTFSELARVPTGETPHTVAVAEGVAFVTDSRDNRLRTVPGGLAADTGNMPESVTVAGPYVVTGDADSGTFSVFTRDGLRPVRRVAAGSRPVRVMALAGERVVSSLNGESRAVVVAAASGKVERRLRTGGHPDGLCLSPSGEYLAVASNEAGSVQVFRVKDWARAGTFDAGAGPGACAWMPSPLASTGKTSDINVSGG